MQKLDYYGIRGIALDWFTNYLRNRKKFVNLNCIDSSLITTLGGVAQGSFLEPSLFLIYIKDIVNTSELTKFTIFADDIKLFFKHKNLNPLTATIRGSGYNFFCKMVPVSEGLASVQLAL